MNTSLSPLLKRKAVIACSDTKLEGDLSIPVHATGLVIFALGSETRRQNPKSQLVADEMHRHGLATLLFDMLSEEEKVLDQRTGALSLNISFLSKRLIEATLWARNDPLLQTLGIGYFGFSTGAAAAFVAATRIPEIHAIVSSGGHTDLADHLIDRMRVPTLCLAGEYDVPVIRWNKETLERVPAETQLSIIPGSSHLFYDPGALDKVSHQAIEWFKNHLRKISG